MNPPPGAGGVVSACRGGRARGADGTQNGGLALASPACSSLGQQRLLRRKLEIVDTLIAFSPQNHR
jgi:hypothetical protein